MTNFTKLIILLSIVLVAPHAHGQKIKVEHTLGVGTFTFANGAARVEPGPDWKGYPLPRNNKTGIQVAAGSGLRLFSRLHVGANVAYVRYDGINGMLAYGTLAVDVLKTKFTPFLMAEPGYSHFWNQYDGGWGELMLNLGGGVRYRLDNRHIVSISAGSLWMQMNAYMGLKAQLSF